MINIYPLGIPSAQLIGVPLIPFVFGIPSAEAFGTPNIPAYVGITSQESFGLPTVGIWWLHWRAFDNFNMYMPVVMAFSAKVERYQYAENLMLNMELGGKYKYDWKFTPRKFGRPILPKMRVWDHLNVWIREGLR